MFYSPKSKPLFGELGPTITIASDGGVAFELRTGKDAYVVHLRPEQVQRILRALRHATGLDEGK